MYEKNVMANEICRSEFYFLVFFSELIVTCLIGFHRLVRISMEMVERYHYFQCLEEQVLKIFFQANGIAGFGDLNLFLKLS
jgi:hypothetical protein